MIFNTHDNLFARAFETIFNILLQRAIGLNSPTLSREFFFGIRVMNEIRSSPASPLHNFASNLTPKTIKFGQAWSFLHVKPSILSIVNRQVDQADLMDHFIE